MSVPKFSVIITCYNYARYLPEAVESALKQTFQDFEIVIVNDGSTDESEEVMKRYASHPKVRCITQANGGQANAKNRGIRQTRGELVAFLDADDFWEPTKLEKQAPLFADPRVGVVYARSRLVGEDSRPLNLPDAPGKLWRGEVLRELLLDNFLPFSSSVVRREALQRFGVFDESLRMAIDWDLWLRLSTAYTFDYVPESLSVYRMDHPGQMSKNMRTRLECCDRIYKKVFEQFADRIRPEDARRARVYTYNSRAYYYRRLNPAVSLDYALRSIRMQPFQVNGWRAGIMALLARVTGPSHG